MDQSSHVASRHRSNNTRRLKTAIDQSTHRLGILHPMNWENVVPRPSALLGEDGIFVGGEEKSRYFDLASIELKSGESFPPVEVSSDFPALREFIRIYNRVADEHELDEIPEETISTQVKPGIEQALYEYACDREGVSIPSAFVIGIVALAESLIYKRD
jgi:hypothetical protein